MSAGIVGCGIYLPRLRIKCDEYRKTWGYFAPRWLEEKTVADFDEDPITMAVEAASNALRNADLDASQIDALYFASTSPPYAEKLNASTVATALNCRSDIATLDIASSIKCGISALLSGFDYVESGRGRCCIIVAADAPVADPTGSLDQQMGAAAASTIISSEQVGALMEGSSSITKDSLGERFRRDGHRYLQTVDLGRYQEASAEEIVTSCVTDLMKKLERTAGNYDFFVLHGLEDGRTIDLARRLGFKDGNVSRAMFFANVGDSGAASPVLALSKVLESAMLKQHIILCSYGPGAGADALSLVVEAEMKTNPALRFEDYLARKEYVDYPTYLKLRAFLGGN